VQYVALLRKPAIREAIAFISRSVPFSVFNGAVNPGIRGLRKNSALSNA